MSDNTTHPSTLLSPIDSRYRQATLDLVPFLSDFALAKYRVYVEVEYLIALAKRLSEKDKSYVISEPEKLRQIHKNFSVQDFDVIYQHERRCNHDIKAVEYFLREQPSIPDALKNMIHFALTSQDINNTAIPLMLRDGITQVYLVCLKKLMTALDTLATDTSDTVMLSRTHGQPATPTSMGKELKVFGYRMSRQITFFEHPAEVYQAKFSGTVGNFNAHIAAYPTINWPEFADEFIHSLGMSRQQYTTQVSNYDDFAEIFNAMSRINTILMDLVKDIWEYISIGYFKLRVVSDEVGSSVMPHKVNPIDFENAEGNLGIANAMFTFFAQKLPISRLQRDLSDSTVLRNVSVGIAHTEIALKAITRGLSKLSVDNNKIQEDLRKNWCVVTEAIQTILRREGIPDPYTLLKNFSRGRELTSDDTLAFIETLAVPDSIKAELSAITPFNYTGNSLSTFSIK